MLRDRGKPPPPQPTRLLLLTGIWLLIEDCSLIIQPGCWGRHRRGQEELSRREEEEAAAVAEVVPEPDGDDGP